MTDRDGSVNVQQREDEEPNEEAEAVVAAPEDDGTHETVDAPDSDAPDESPVEGEWISSIGAFVLGALDEESMRAAAAAYAESEAAQIELAELVPVAGILTGLYQQQPTSTPAPVSSPEPAVESAAAEPQQTGWAPQIRRPTRAARPGNMTGRLPSPGSLATSSIVMAALALVAVAGILWALALTDRIRTRDFEIDTLNQQIADMRSTANAKAFALFPTVDGGNAHGTIFVAPADASVLIDIAELPELDEDMVYQLWFQRTDGGDWEPGPTFLVNDQGDSVQRSSGDTPNLRQIAVTREPAPGSTEPTEPFLLTGQLAESNG